MSEESAIEVVISDVVMPLIPDFLEMRGEDAANIPNLVESRDFAAIWRLGHNMKGNGAAYGFKFITEMGAIIEQAAHVEDGGAINAAVVRLADYLRRVVVVSEGN